MRFIEQTWDLEYRHAVGEAATNFFDAILERRLIGSKCPSCRRVLVPPRSFCDTCFEATSDYSEVGPRATLEAFTIVYQQFKNMPEPPYIIAYARPDGADNAFVGFLRVEDLTPAISDELKVGTALDVHIAEEPKGTVLDYWFEVAS